MKKRIPSRLIIAVILALVIALITGWNRSLNVTPKIVIPPVTMPSPNGFDLFIAAANDCEADEDYLAQILEAPAFSGHTLPLSQKENLLKRYHESLELVRRGLAFEYRHPREYRPFEGEHPFVCIGELFELEGQVNLEHKDWDSALVSYLDMIRFGELIPRGGNYYPKTIASRITCRGCEGIWQTVDHLTASQCRMSATRIEQFTANHWPFHKTIEEHKIYVRKALSEVFKQPDWRSCIIQGYRYDDLRSAIEMACQKPKITAICAFSGKADVLHPIDKHFDQWAKRARSRYGCKSLDPGEPKNIFVRAVDGHETGRLFFYDTRSQTLTNILMVSLALRAYKLEHGNYPETLTKLIPSYLRNVPTDLFATKGDLKYRITGKSYILYSVGPDGKDDGGKPVIVRQDLDPTYVNRCSKGDIVAGVNR